MEEKLLGGTKRGYGLETDDFFCINDKVLFLLPPATTKNN